MLDLGELLRKIHRHHSLLLAPFAFSADTGPRHRFKSGFGNDKPACFTNSGSMRPQLKKNTTAARGQILNEKWLTI
jgi:hypothetical protein